MCAASRIYVEHVDGQTEISEDEVKYGMHRDEQLPNSRLGCQISTGARPNKFAYDSRKPDLT